MYQFELRDRFLGTRVLRHDPKGWDMVKLELSRDAKYHGVAQSYTSELAFVKDGKRYLEECYERDGIEAQVEATIRQYNPNAFRYEDLHAGLVGFTKYLNDGISLRAEITQTTLAQRLLNQDDVEVNLLSSRGLQDEVLPKYPNMPLTVQMHSKEILQRYRGKSKAQAMASSPTFVSEGWSRGPYLVFGFNDVEVNELGLTNQMTGFMFFDGPADGLPEVMRAEAMGAFEISFTLDATISIELINGDYDKARIGFYFRVNDGPETELTSFNNSNVGGSLKERLTASYSTILNLEIGDRIYIYGKLLVEDVSGAYRLNYVAQMHDASFLSIDFQTRTPATDCEGVLVYEAFSRVCEAIAGRSPAFYSEFFGRTDSFPTQYAQDGPGALLFITGGFQLRGFPLRYDTMNATFPDARELTANFKNLFESMDAIFCLGAGIETVNGVEVIRVEPLEYFYSQEVVLDLGDVSGVKRAVAMDYYHATAEFGFQKWKTNQENSLGEFNAKQTYLLPLTQAKGKYSKLSPYIAGGFLIEEARRDRYDPLKESEGKAKEEDDSRFLVALLRNGVGFVTERDQEITLGNVYSPGTAYNARLSPKNSILRHGHMLKAALLKQESKKIKFNAGEGNIAMGTRFEGEDTFLYENADVPVSQLPDPFFIPETYEFTRPLSREERETIKANPYGLVAFADTTYTPSRQEHGYVLSLSDDPNEGLAEFKLLRAFRQ